jgi:hypothetical protein
MIRIAFAGTLLIGGVPVLICASRSVTTGSASRVVAHDPRPTSAGQLTLSPTEKAGQVPAVVHPSSNPSSRASKGSEQPMNQSRANVSILSAVTLGSGEVRISGTASPGANVTVNGAPVGLHPDGTWSVTLSVGHGPNVVNVAAVSASGSSRSSSSVTVNG